jgi:hypothetical protein
MRILLEFCVALAGFESQGLRAPSDGVRKTGKLTIHQ